MNNSHWGWMPLLACTPALVQAAPQPPLMHAETLLPDRVLESSDYLVSEKLDGVRAYWDGHQLLTRQGFRIAAPSWFTERLPAVPLDGELWLGRGQFQPISTLVRTGNAQDPLWHQVSYQLFDLPAHPGTFSERSAALRELIAPLDQPQLVWLEQRPVANRATLEQWLEASVANGGEGLMLHHRAARYQAERSALLLKYKRYQDAEATVLGYTQGQGKYSGQVGALIVETDHGIRLRLGSGLSDAERLNPPPLGSRITFRYNGLTAQGKPRFARFMRRYEAGL